MRPLPEYVDHSIISRFGSVSILVSWYKNSGTDPPGSNACAAAAAVIGLTDEATTWLDEVVLSMIGLLDASAVVARALLSAAALYAGSGACRLDT